MHLQTIKFLNNFLLFSDDIPLIDDNQSIDEVSSLVEKIKTGQRCKGRFEKPFATWSINHNPLNLHGCNKPCCRVYVCCQVSLRSMRDHGMRVKNLTIQRPIKRGGYAYFLYKQQPNFYVFES